jgi:hypothetical protein
MTDEKQVRCRWGTLTFTGTRPSGGSFGGYELALQPDHANPFVLLFEDPNPSPELRDIAEDRLRLISRFPECVLCVAHYSTGERLEIPRFVLGLDQSGHHLRLNGRDLKYRRTIEGEQSEQKVRLASNRGDFLVRLALESTKRHPLPLRYESDESGLSPLRTSLRRVNDELGIEPHTKWGWRLTKTVLPTAELKAKIGL